jgi:hypothetical protein
MRKLAKTKFVVAAAILGAALLAFVGEASAAPNEGSGGEGSGTVIHMCVCVGSCRLVTMCLLTYCYTETVCDDCANCHARNVSEMMTSKGQKLCLYRKGSSCVTHVTTRRRR